MTDVNDKLDRALSVIEYILLSQVRKGQKTMEEFGATLDAVEDYIETGKDADPATTGLDDDRSSGAV